MREGKTGARDRRIPKERVVRQEDILPEEYLKPTKYADITPEVQALAARLTKGFGDDQAKAVAIFYFIRDLKFGGSPIYAASKAVKYLERPLICASKAILQVALLRSVGIPARFHIWRGKFSGEVSKKISELLSLRRGSFKDSREIYHVAAEVYLGKWIVADATVDSALSKVIKPSEWDGKEDALMEDFEVLEDLGSSADIPPEIIELETGRFLPLHLRLLYPLLKRGFYRKLNRAFERARRMGI